MAATAAAAERGHEAKGEADPGVLGRDDVQSLFRSVSDGADTIVKRQLVGALREQGLEPSDARLEKTMARLSGYKRRDPIDEAAFAHVVAPCAGLIARALRGLLVVPRWSAFTDEVDKIFEETLQVRDGANADYIPLLARADPEKYGVAITTVDGQIHTIGNSDEMVCLQSCSKPITYLLALVEHGSEHVHRFVGREPSGVSFNALSLNPRNQPFNPYINAGAIMVTSLLRADQPMSARFSHVLSFVKALAGNTEPGYSNATFLSERATADRNFALAHLMRGAKAFPDGTDLHRTLELYFQTCSIEVTVAMASVIAASLANAGVCPITERKVVGNPEHVRHVLSLMHSCGLYDYSGEFAFTIGLPAKSGVSGLIILVVPGVCGVATWSPRLDEIGNSARGIAFCREFADRFGFHIFDSSTGAAVARNPAQRGEEMARIMQFLFAASEGDLVTLNQLLARRVSVDMPDYDRRRALHVAASEGQVDAVRLLLRHGARADVRDRWDHTPLDEARRVGNAEIVAMLEEAAAAQASAAAASGP